jgi:opacity protein-like surface antigen
MLMRERAKRATRAERGGGVTVIQNLVGVAIVLVALASAAAAQTAANFTGKWEGTFRMQRSGGEEGDPRPVVFDLTQKGKVLTGTAGPTAQWKVENGVVKAGTATFDVQQPDGPLFKFTLTIVKGRLQGDMAGTREGVVRGHAKVDAAKAK